MPLPKSYSVEGSAEHQKVQRGVIAHEKATVHMKITIGTRDRS